MDVQPRIDRGPIWVICTLVAAAALLLGAGACGPAGDDTGSAVDSGNSGNESDAGGSSNSDATPDAGGDAGTSDADGGDTGPDCATKNGPDTSVDRDRDGLPDDCDNLPFLNHGGKNPKKPQVIKEREGEVSNDDARAGETYDANFPFVFQGKVNPIKSGDADFDYVSFEVDEPTALLIKIEARTGDYWPGGAILGYEFTNNNSQYIMFGDDTGEDTVREVFLPVPGQYSIAVTDARNIDPNLTDVGSKTKHKYRARISKVPLPERESVSAPATKSHDYKHRLHAYEMDASKLDGLSVKATGTGSERNAFQNPVVALYHPKSNRTISYTIGQQVDRNTREVSLKTKLSNVDGTILVVEDVSVQYRDTKSQLEFKKATVDSEFESVQDPQDQRASNLVWMQPEDSVKGTIGPPRKAGATSLRPDDDYYLVSAKRGMAVEVTVKPDSGSKLRPKVTLGTLLAESESSSRFIERTGHTAPAAPKVGGERTIRFVHTSVREGEFAIRVRHGPNTSGSNKVGGSEYGYEISVEKWKVQPVDLGSAPGTAKAAINDEGGSGVVTFTSQNDALYRIVPDVPSSLSSFDLEGRAIQKSTWEQLRTGSEDLEISAQSGEEYWYDFRDDEGRDTDGKKVQVNVRKIQPGTLKNFPATGSGTINDSNEVDYYKFSASEGDKLDVRLRVTNSLFGRFTIYRLKTMDGVATGIDEEVFKAPEDGEYLLKVERLFNDSGDYTIGVQKIQPASLSSLPSTKSNTLNQKPFPQWYSFDVKKGTLYQARLEETGSASFDKELEAYDSESLDSVTDGDGSIRFRAQSDGTIFLAVFDEENRGNKNYDFELQVSELREKSHTVGQTISGQLSSGSDAVVYTFSKGAGALELDVTTTGSWTPNVALLDKSDLESIDDVRNYRGSLRYATAQMREYALLVEARDTSRSGTLNFTVNSKHRSASSTVTEQEPNNSAAKAQSIGSFPAVVDGSLGKSGDKTDVYEFDLQAGQRVWALAVAQSGSNRRAISPDMRLDDPAGNLHELDAFSGDGSFPALYAEEVDESGTWRLQLDDPGGSSSYYLYLYRSKTFTASESEPNDSQSTAQALGAVDAPASISATVNGGDPTDIFKFKVRRHLDSLEIFLENAKSGHNLRLLDSSFSQLKAAGPAHGGSSSPSITSGSLAPGTYFVEVGQGNGGGKLDLIMIPSP